MTKLDIALQIAKELNLHQTVSRRIVQMVLDELLNVIATERRLELRNFGIFEVQRRKPRMARNPRTGASVMIPEKKVVTFKPGLSMQQRVNRQEAAKITQETPATDA